MADPLRISLAIPNESRDATRAKDSWGKNCFLEKDATALRAVARPGTAAAVTTPGVLGSGVWNYNGVVYQIVSGNLYQAPFEPTWGTLTALGIPGGGTIFSSVIEGNGHYLLGYHIAFVHHLGVSTDGTTFTQATEPNPISASGCYPVLYANGYFYGLALGVGLAYLFRSGDNGSSWTQLTGGLYDGFPMPFGNQSFGQLFLVAVGTTLYLGGLNAPYNTSQICASTNNGTTWGTPTNIDTTHWVYYPTYFNGAIYFLSLDGVRKTTNLFVSSSLVYPLDFSTYGGMLAATSTSLFLVVTGGGTLSSSDGTTWVLLSSGTSAAGFGLITVADSVYSYSGTNKQILVTTNLNLGTVVSSPFFDFLDIDPASGVTGFVFKSTANAYHYNTGTSTLTHVTDADYPANTVPGLAFLDGTYYVMDPLGRIWGSDINNFLSWGALNVISIGDSGVAITNHLNFIAAFSETSTYFFYDAGNPTGSPLLPYTSADADIGCAAARSIVSLENKLFLVGQSNQKGRGVYMIDGTTLKPVSNPSIDRVLNADDLATVYSCGVRISGHNFYVLTLVDSAITLVLDIMTGDWKEWTSLTLGTPVTGKTATYANGQVSVASTAHGLTDGTVVRVSAGTDTAFNGDVLAMYVDANTWAYVPATAPTHSSNTVTYTSFTESYFFGVNYTGFAAYDVFQDGAGNLYTADADLHTDSGYPISVDIRTPILDGGEVTFKFQPQGKVVGDTIPSTLYMRYSNDDYQTWSGYRPISMSQQRKLLNRQGRFRRRAYEVKHIADQLLRVESIELSVEKGSS